MKLIIFAFLAVPLISFETIASVIDQEMKAEIENIIKAEINLLENEVGRFHEEALKAHGKCDVKHGNACFFSVVVGNGKVNREGARLSCEKKGAVLAGIYSEQHYVASMDYLRPWIAAKTESTGNLGIYTGMVYEPQSKIMYLPNLTRAPYVKWSSNYPKSDRAATSVILAIYPTGHSSNGMRNYSPQKAQFGTLCEIKITENLFHHLRK